jgi:hypothetical protein
VAATLATHDSSWSDKASRTALLVLYETIEFRIIYLQREQFRLLPEGHHQGGAAAHPAQCAAGMDA